MASKSIIVETEHVTAIEQDMGGDTVVVTFNEMGFVRNGANFWGDEFLFRLGVSAIGIVTPRPNWYPPRDMDKVIPAVLEKIKGRRVVTYGHSQGGFGALKFSSRLKAYIALCFCPQWTIDPKDCGSFDTRTTKYFDPALGNGVHLIAEDVCKRSFIFYDKREPADARHAAVLSQYEGVYPVMVPFAMHDTIRILTEGREASTVIKLCRNASPPTAEDFRQIIRRARRKSKTYEDYKLRNLILRMSQSSGHSSLFLSRMFAKSGKSNHFYASLIAHAQGDAALARTELTNTSAKDFEDIDLLFLWSLTNDMKFFAAEVALAMHIPRIQPSNTWACLHAVKTFMRASRFLEAQTELRRISLNPDASDYASYMNEFAQIIQQSSAASAASAA